MLGWNARPLLPAVLQAVQDPDPVVAIHAIWSLPWICPEEPSAIVPALTAQLSNAHPRIREYAARTLGNYRGKIHCGPP